jgi:polyhydroxyalkanoate synthase
MILPQLDPATLRAQRAGLDGLRATLEVDAAKALRAAEQLPLEGKASLHYYPPQRRAVRRPLLLIYSLINRPQILDLTEERSFVGRLRQLGHAVYVVDWGRPDVTDAGVSLADYVTGYLPMAVHAIRSRHRAHSVDVVGVCQGGTLGLCLASLNPDLVHRLVTLAAPVDFHTAGDTLAALAARIEPRRLLGVDGNLEGRALANLFRLLACLRDGGGSKPPWLDPDQVLLARRLRQWQADCPDQAGRAWLDFVTACYRNNDLIAGRLSFGGATVELQRLEVPVLNVVARADHLVPPRASLALGRIVAATGYRELLIDGGHLAALIGRRGLATVPAAVSRFLRAGPSRRRSK